ncbi:MAG: OmpA family protein, partial [Bacteroidetes bacterium]|nr:OmpA family protein [Bacteroidota bacterium]
QGENAGYAHSSNSGDYKIVLPYGKNYGFLAETAGFVSISDNIDLTQIAEYQEIERDLFLVPLEVGETVRLNNIFFDFGKYQLRPGSNPELERVYKLLAENPNLSIEIGGHTDDVGPSEENTVLSLNRAGAVKKYLIDKGIPDNKVKARGFGETKPLAPNSNESNRQLNRRVEFTILKK